MQVLTPSEFFPQEGDVYKRLVFRTDREVLVGFTNFIDWRPVATVEGKPSQPLRSIPELLAGKYFERGELDLFLLDPDFLSVMTPAEIHQWFEGVPLLIQDVVFRSPVSTVGPALLLLPRPTATSPAG